MIVFDKQTIKNQISVDDIFDLLEEFNGNPRRTDFGIISETICHNRPGEGSKKLYFYTNSKLFTCFTGCSEHTFDVFQLIIKVFKINEDIDLNLNDAVRWVAHRFHIEGSEEDEPLLQIPDWKIFESYEKLQNINVKDSERIILKEYDKTILDRFNYKVKLTPWLQEHIAPEVLQKAQIGYYPGGEQITIPHFDQDGRLIGLRGRTLIQEEAQKYGKYCPIQIGNIIYSHPLGMNLYGLNWNKNNIKNFEKAIIFESEKSVLKYASYFSWDNNISVAVCGSSLSSYQVNLLKDAGAKEIILAFDKQYKMLSSEESHRWRVKLTQINNKYKNEIKISIMWDKFNLLNYKSSPIDEGKEKFLFLFANRIFL